MKAEEFYKEKGGYNTFRGFTELSSTGINADYNKIFEFAESYHQSKIESITIRQIETILPSTLSIKDSHKNYLMGRFLKRLKQLLNNA